MDKPQRFYVDKRGWQLEVLAWNWTHVFYRRIWNKRRTKKLIRDFFREMKPVTDKAELAKPVEKSV